MGRFPVLMYHRIVSDRCPVPGGDREEARYAVSLGAFESQVRRIADNGYRAVSIRDLYDRLSRGDSVPGNWVGVTFDDGNRSDYEHARPLLLEAGFSATFFVSVERLGVPGGLEPEMVAGMAGEGLDIGSHGMTHRFLTDLSLEEQNREMEQSRAVLERVAGTGVDFYAPPGGRIDPRGVAALKKLSYLAMCNSVFGFNRSKGQRFEIGRIAITAATTPALYEKVLGQSVFSLLPLYARDRGLRWARRVLGEKTYARIRASSIGS
jgi:peptidoglycan/xylan/chitin deacetylase (PgdA/CDA1 family)